jgi:hypothetical protein
MDSLISAAVEPLATQKDHFLAAAAVLSETTDSSHPATAETASRLAIIHSRKFPRLILTGIAAAIALVSALSIQIRDIRFLPVLTGNIFGMLDIPSHKPAPSLNPEQRLLLGEPNLSRLDQAKQLHQSAQDNPAYYTEYIVEYCNKHSALPPDYFETVARIAPENSFFIYWAAGQIGGDSVEKKSRPGTSQPSRMIDGVRLSPLPSEKDFIITDQTAFREATTLLEKAALLPDFKTYTSEMIAARTRLLPYENLAEYMRSVMVLFGAPSPMISLRKVSDLFFTQAQIQSLNQEREQFTSLVERQKHFIHSQANNPDINLINELVFSVNASMTSQHFHWAADRLGMAEMSEDYKTRMLAFQNERDQRDIRDKKESDYLRKRGSMLSHMSLAMVERQVSTPPPIAAADLKPLRLVDHDIASRFGITAAALLLAAACLPVFLFRFFYRTPVRVTAAHLSKLLTAADWAWITGLGIILPLAVYLTISRLTTLGGRDYGIQAFYFHFPSIHLIAILLSLLLAPAVLIRWRLSIRLAPFGIACHPGILPMTLLGLILVWALSAFPIIEKFAMSQSMLIAMATVPSLCLGYIIFSLLRKPANSIARVATSAALLPAYSTAILALCLTIPIFTSSEKYWIKQDTLFHINPDAPDLGAYEFRVAAQKRKETKTILGL